VEYSLEDLVDEAYWLWTRLDMQCDKHYLDSDYCRYRLARERAWGRYQRRWRKYRKEQANAVHVVV
jgi:hypothetical protein